MAIALNYTWPSDQAQRDAEDAVVMGTLGVAHGGAQIDADQKANDSAYSNLLDASTHTGPVGSTHAWTPPPVVSVPADGANALSGGGASSSASAPGPGAPPVVYGPGGSLGTLPSHPLHLADALMAVHNNSGATGLRRVIDDVSTKETGLGQAEAKQSRAC